MSEDRDQSKAMVLLSELDILSNLDLMVTPDMVTALCQRSGALVSAAEQSEDYTFLIKAWSCWSFYETVIPNSGGKKKWQKTRICDPKTGYLPPLAESWKGFCQNHLRMAGSTVSGYKSIWDTYVIKLETELSRLSLAGKSKLLVAQGLIKDMWPGTNQNLLDKLFDPEVTLAELTDLVQKLRKEMDQKDDEESEPDKGSFRGHRRYNTELGTEHWTGFFILNGVEYPLRELVFDVLGEDVIGTGIPVEILSIFEAALDERLGGSS